MGGTARIVSRKGTPFGPFRMDEVEVDVREPDGTSYRIERVSFERGDAVAVLAHNEADETVILTRQFRYPALANSNEGGSGWLTEIVAGILEPDELAETTARREIEEEIGAPVLAIEPIATFFVSPGGTSERVQLYYAKVGRRPSPSAGGGLAHENEHIEVVEMPVTEFLRQATANELRDAKTLIAAAWLKARLGARAVSRGRRARR